MNIYIYVYTYTCICARDASKRVESREWEEGPHTRANEVCMYMNVGVYARICVYGRLCGLDMCVSERGWRVSHNGSTAQEIFELRLLLRRFLRCACWGLIREEEARWTFPRVCDMHYLVEDDRTEEIDLLCWVILCRCCGLESALFSYGRRESICICDSMFLDVCTSMIDGTFVWLARSLACNDGFCGR